MSHDYHEGLVGYVEGAIFQDGCEECEFRAAHFELGHMDLETWIKARERAFTLAQEGLPRTSDCEIRVLRGIHQVLMKEREYIDWAIRSAVTRGRP